jgi:hypothetical protein
VFKRNVRLYLRKRWGLRAVGRVVAAGLPVLVLGVSTGIGVAQALGAQAAGAQAAGAHAAGAQVSGADGAGVSAAGRDGSTETHVDERGAAGPDVAMDAAVGVAVGVAVRVAVRGVVTDASGAVVAGAVVRAKAVGDATNAAGARNRELGAAGDGMAGRAPGPGPGPGPVTDAVTDGQGRYKGRYMLRVVVGRRYRLIVEAKGFARYERPVVVDRGQIANGEAGNGLVHGGAVKGEAGRSGAGDGTATLAVVALQPERQSEDVTVEGQTQPQEDVTETERGAVLGTDALAALPVNGRSFTDLLAVTPGVVPVSSAQPNAVVMSGVASTPPSGDLDIGALSVSGQRETANAFRVNGADVQEDVNMGVAIVPTLDSIGELRILTGSFDAKLGNQSGGQVLVTTRAGGAQLHGSVYDYYRTTALDARSYFSTTRAPYHQNQFGGTLGGPVRVGGLHWDAVKFFVDYQGTRQKEGIDTGSIAVPSEADRTGNLSDSVAALTGTVHGDAWAQTLSNRLGYAVSNGEPYTQAGCQGTQYAAGSGTGCVFPGAVIPTGAWSAPAKALLGYIPEPNGGSGASFGTASVTEQVRDDKGAVRLDMPTRAGQLSLYGFVDDYQLANPYPTAQGGASVPGFSAQNDGRAQLYAANLTSSFGANTVNTAHVSYMRNAAVVGQPVGGQGVSLAAQGFVTGAAGIVPQQPAIEGVENLVFNDFTLGTTVTGLSQAENLMEATDDVQHMLGSHLLELGVSGHLDQINTHPNVYDNGSFSFTGSETGLDFADFLLGIDSNYTQGDGQDFYNRNHYSGIYAQDSWRLRPGLALNYGLRWDVLPPWSEKNNQLLTLNANEQSVVFPNAPKGILFPGDPGVARTIAPTDYKDFAPRVALAWSPQGGLLGDAGTTVVRAGYGVYYSAFEGLSAGIMSGNPPYGFTDTTAAPTLVDQPFVEASTGASLGQPFPLQHVAFGASRAHPNNDVNWANFEPLTGIPAFADTNVTPYSENYALTVERQLGARTSLSVGYVGTQAHHLLVIQEVNPGNPALCLALSTQAAVAAGSATCGPFNESSTFTAANGQVYNGTRSAYSSAFGSVNLQKTIANAHDNALEMKLEHRTRALYVQLAYTWSRSIDESSSLAEAVYPDTAGGGNAGLSRALSAFDLTHNFTASYRYEVPVGTWARELGWMNRPRLQDGWELSGLTRLGTGLPVTLVNNQDTSLLGTAPNGINGNGIDEPEVAAGDLRVHHRPDAAGFNTGLFSLPALGTMGNARRRFFYGPGEDNTDLAVQKVTALREGIALEIRAEAFNAWNHGQFFGPTAVDGNIGSQHFGQIENASPPRLLQIAGRLRF